MRVVIVFESMFGNTEAVARHVADGLSSCLGAEAVAVFDVGHAPRTIGTDVDLLVIGGPTHTFGMSRPATRQSALEQAGTTATSVTTGMREWLDHVHLEGRPAAAAFDTRVRVKGMPGSAARKAEKRLRRLGATIATPAASFWVAGTPGPLVDGELARARAWGATLAATPAAASRG